MKLINVVSLMFVSVILLLGCSPKEAKTEVLDSGFQPISAQEYVSQCLAIVESQNAEDAQWWAYDTMSFDGEVGEVGVGYISLYSEEDEDRLFPFYVWMKDGEVPDFVEVGKKISVGGLLKYEKETGLPYLDTGVVIRHLE